jgi:ATP-dependent RNA helicase DDX55/SPB4
MPELREFNGKLKYFISAGPEVDIYKIPFLDKARETTRQKRLAVELAAGGKNAKQIKAEQKKADQVMRSKERRKVAVDKGRNPDKKRGRNAQIVDEWEELAKEERLYKKFRRGKITKEKYEELMFGSLKTGDDAPQNIAAGQESSSDDDDDDDDN